MEIRQILNAIKIMFLIIIIQNCITEALIVYNNITVAPSQPEQQTQEYIYNGQHLPPMEELEYPD